MTFTTAHLSMSLDGYVAGPDQSLDQPLGRDGISLHRWHIGPDDERHEVDVRWSDRILRPGCSYVMGRNMFGPVRGPWPNDDWKGWWGEEPVYRCPVFVLTHHARSSLPMKGGTTFHFVTGGIHEALERARAAAGGLDVRLGGGVASVRAYLRERLVDELHLAVSPVLLGRGESLFAGLDLDALGYRGAEAVAGERATHVYVRRKDGGA